MRHKVIDITPYNFRLRDIYSDYYSSVAIFIESGKRFPLCCVLKSKSQAPNKHNFAVNPSSAILTILDSFPPTKKIPEEEMDALWFALARDSDSP